MSFTAPPSEARGPLWPVLAPWLVAAGADSLIAWGSYVRPEAYQFFLEWLVLAGMGWAQWTFGRGWWRSPMLPAAFLAVFAVLPHSPAGAAHSIPFLVGVVLTLVAFLRWSHGRPFVGTVAGVFASLTAVYGAHWIDARSQAGNAAIAGAIDRSEEPRLTEVRDPGVGVPLVVISVDTLRADAAATMASVRRLSERGAYWPRAMSASSWTLPALASLQTGRLPADHGAACLEDGHCQGISGSVSTLAEDLLSRGWTTGAVVANPWAGASMGFDRGFGRFVDAGEPGRRLLVGGVARGAHGQDDSRTVDAAIKLIDEGGERGFYLWVHLMGPHMPYLHSPIEKMRVLDPVTLRSSYPSSERQKKEIRDAYANEVAYTDTQVMRLLDVLEAKGVLDRGVVVFTSDHGEEFWDHGGVEHGHSHHGEVIDVPLVLVAPGLAAGPRSGVASLVDVAPTLRFIAGLPGEGIDLREGVPPQRVATAWGGLILRLDCSVRQLEARLLVQDCSPEASSMRLYDLLRDPAERWPVLPPSGHPLVAEASRIGRPLLSEAASVSSERLRALGYLQ